VSIFETAIEQITKRFDSMFPAPNQSGNKLSSGIERFGFTPKAVNYQMTRQGTPGGLGPVGSMFGGFSHYDQLGGQVLQGIKDTAAAAAAKAAEASRAITGGRPDSPYTPAAPKQGAYGGDLTGEVPHQALVNKYAAQHQVDPALVAAIMNQESGGLQYARSDMGASGVMQLMPQTARGLGVTDIYDLDQNIEAGTRYLRQQLDQFGDVERALVAYNWGPGRAQGWSGDRSALPAETQLYLQKVLPRYEQLQQNIVQQVAANPVAAAQQGYVFPVQGYRGRVDAHHGVAEARGGSDIMANEGTPVVAMRGGRVLNAGFDNTGGNFVMIAADDGNQYYYAHLQNAPLVRTGQAVTAGVPLGAVGRTGNARNTPPHLHIGIGPQIVNGVGPQGGTGGSFDAIALLQAALELSQQPVSQPMPQSLSLEELMRGYS
jgi:soluble lytic murein transglycosylase-like protein